MKFAKVIVDISHEKLDRLFDYKIPESLEKEIHAGTAVMIPFGRGNRSIQGYVIEVTEAPAYAPEKIKSILSLAENATTIESQLISLAWWIKENYGSTMNQALKTVIPVKKKVKDRTTTTIELCLSDSALQEKLVTYQRKNCRARIRLLQELEQYRQLPKSLVVSKLNISDSTLKTMEKLGDIRLVKKRLFRNPVSGKKQPEHTIVLNQQQQQAADAIKKTMNFSKEDGLNIHLIHGITGSGKTEVYMDLIEYTLSKNKSVIVLIPEIALTYQTVMRFQKRFGDVVSIINSKLSAGERYDQFERAKNGEIRIMIGPRSALFTPFTDLGLIVIDEEHEGAYKSETVPKYNAIEVAHKRIADTGATLVLGSATPSMEAYYRAKKGIYQLHTIDVRETGSLAEVSLVDLRQELQNGNKSVFSHELKDLIEDRLNKKEQTMLFMNRRGYAGFVSCRDCGKAIRCPHCDVTLKLHKNRKLVCHYCGYTENLPGVCPECGSKFLGSFGIGTQQIESLLKKDFPQARILRMDADTTGSRGGHEEILSAFANEQADILVGTQMIVKGHDFPNVTLVGVIAADLSLYESDFRAPERTFQLLCQAAGRAGRSSKPGKVVIQTYAPDNYSIQAAAKQDYPAFFEEELAYRSLMGYPPVSNMVCVMLMGENRNELHGATEEMMSVLRSVKEQQNQNLMIIGPSTPPVSKIKDIYRNVIYLKDSRRQNLVIIKDYLEQATNRSQKFKNIHIQYDFNM